MAHSHTDFDARAIGAAQALEGSHAKILHDTTEENEMKYEYWYNWDYAQEHNPKLMSIGRSGGFGLTRRNMIEYVDQGNKMWAERCFWKLVTETNEEWLTELNGNHDHVYEEKQLWFKRIMAGDAVEQFDDLRHFIRPIPLDLSGGPDWERGYQQQPQQAPLLRERPEGMKDTILDLYPDPMVIVTTQHPDLYLKEGNTYAQELREFIEWFHDDEAGDPMDPTAIY